MNILVLSSLLFFQVDLHLRPAGCQDGEVYVDVVAVAERPTLSSAVQFIVESRMPFLRAETELDWMVADTLPDPDGINDDVTDGQLIFTCLTVPNAPTVLQTCGTTVATLVFEGGGAVRIPKERGEWAESGVWLYYTPNTNVLGDTYGLRTSCNKGD
jgi:hypothetical protein